MTIPWWGLIPFIIMLGSIAILPLVPATKHWWEKNSSKLVVALGLGLPIAAWMWLSHAPHLVTHSLLEYAQFITLLFSLFVVSGGIYLAGDIRATPRNNALLLLIGATMASFIGTTGAAMLLIRPILNTNRERQYKVHTVIFAILMVANCGGLLTPLGDPPLYIGLMRGVPFTWTFGLFIEWFYVNALLLITYYALDSQAIRKESEFALRWDEASRTPLSMHGKSNLIWFVVIIASVALISDPFIKIAIQLAASAASYFLGDRAVRYEDNNFSWDAIIEVAVLFIGIFLTMIPALQFLAAHANSMPLNAITLFVFTGALSSVLDNAPTYLTFFEMARELTVPGMAVVAGVPEMFLRAISLGAVTCGAVTYIGNGPNFMVKSVAEGCGVAMPSFAGYVGWTFRYLVPILTSMMMIFLTQSRLANLAGIALGVVLILRSVMLARRPVDVAELTQDDQTH